MNLIAGQRCPIAHCGGTLLAQKDQFGPRLVCTLCSYQEDPCSENLFLRPPSWKKGMRDGPRTRKGIPNFQPWRQRERDAWQREIEHAP